MSKSNELTMAEELYIAHEVSHNQLERAQRIQNNIRQSGLLNRSITKVTGKTSDAQAAVQKAQKLYDVALRIPQDQIDAIREQADEARITKAVYEVECTRVITEVDPQYERRIGGLTWPSRADGEKAYIDEYLDLKTEISKESPDTVAKALAVRDVFFPKVNEPEYAGSTFTVGDDNNAQSLAIPNGKRFPRFDIGFVDLDGATKIATSNGWDKVVKMSVSITSDKAPENDEEPYVLAESTGFTAVGNETAALLDLIAPSISSSSGMSEAFGRRQGMSAGTTSNIQFTTLTI